MPNDEQITLFGETNFRGVKRRFGIKRKDRRRHMYIIGKTGMGKTTLLENMTIQDIQSGEGVGIVDPHGEYAERMLDFVPASRINDIVYFNPVDTENPVAFNVMEDVGAERRHLVSSGLIGVFKKIWPDVWSARMEYLLSNSILALLETPNTTLLGINRMLADKDFRKQVVSNVTDPIVKAFWENEYARYTEKFAAEAGAAVQNKIGQFTSNPLIRNIIGQPKSTIDMRKIMDEKKIFIMNLSKGRIGEENSKLLGAMLITRLYLSAMTRVDIPEADREDFYLYVDEFQNFATESFASILSEARKYRLDLILAHQYVEQMSEEVRAAVFGNVGSMIAFRVGAADAELLEKEFSPEFTIQDIVNLGFASIYMRLMIDGVASRPFSATTLPPVRPQDTSFRDQIVDSSRKLYGRARAAVDAEIMEWQGFGKEKGVVVHARERTDGRIPGRMSPPRAESSTFGGVLGDIRAQRPQALPRRPEGAEMPQPIQREQWGVRSSGQQAIGKEQVREERRQDIRPPFRSMPYRERQIMPGPSRASQTDAVRAWYAVGEKKESPAPSPAEPREKKQGEYRETDERKIPSGELLHRDRPMTDIRAPRVAFSPREAPQRQKPQQPERPIEQKKPFIGKPEPVKYEKPSSFLSLSNLSPRGEEKKKGDIQKQETQKNTGGREKVNFSDLKKALADSFIPKQGTVSREEKSVLHDTTGMMNPRNPNMEPAQKKADSASPAETDQPGTFVAGRNVPPKAQGGVLKPGDRVTF